MEYTQEIDRIYEIQLDPSELNGDLNLKPQSYQILYCKIAEIHLKSYNLGTDETMKYGVAWVLISLTIEIKTPIKGICTLYAKTWKSGLQGPYFRRDFVFEDEFGKIYFQGTSFSVLLNMETRKVCRDKKLPFFSLGVSGLNTTEGFPTWKHAYSKELDQSDIKMEICAKRKVENSFIDMLGHVNNIRYSEFVYDAMDETQIKALDKLSRLEIYFQSELRLGDTFTVSKSQIDGKLCFRGQNLNTKDTSFYTVMIF